MSLSGTIKCPICGRPYHWAYYAGDLGACPACRAEAALIRPDTPEQIRRRNRYWR